VNVVPVHCWSLLIVVAVGEGGGAGRGRGGVFFVLSCLPSEFPEIGKVSRYGS
jgi:hypothetical protein